MLVKGQENKPDLIQGARLAGGLSLFDEEGAMHYQALRESCALAPKQRILSSWSP